MVAAMFEMFLESQSDTEKANQQNILQALTVFAKANSKLFTSDQLMMLQPYVDNITTNDDLIMYRWVVMIYRNVFPAVSSFQHTFLQNVQKALLKNLSRTPPKVVLSPQPQDFYQTNSMIGCQRSCGMSVVNRPSFE